MFMEKLGLDWRDAVVSACLLFCAVFLYRSTNAVVDVDDAYISYRYAANMAEGNGPVCNEGERVYGTTTLAWVTWLACWSRISGLTVERISSLSSVAFLAADCILLYLLMFRLARSRWLSAIAAGMLLFSPYFLLISTVGMETMFYSFFILLSFYCYSCERNFLAGIVAGCAFCTRPDGLAVFAALFAVETVEHWLSSRDRSISALFRSSLRGGPGRLAVGFLLIAIPFALLCYSFFGAVLPQTMHAKRLHDMVSGRWWMPMYFATGFGWPVTVGIIMAIVVFAARKFCLSSSAADAGANVAPEPDGTSAARGFKGRLGVQKTVVVVILWLAMYATAWTIIRIDMYHWYLAAMGPASVFAVFLPLILMSPRKLKVSLRLLFLLWIVCVAFIWHKQTRNINMFFTNYLRRMELCRLDAAENINRFTKPDKERIGLGFIGVIGYHCRSHAVHDLARLVTTQDIIDNPKTQPTLLVIPSPDEGHAKPNDLYVMNAGGHHLEYDYVSVSVSPAFPYCVPVYLDTLARRDGTSSWDVSHFKPSIPVGASLNSSAQLVGVEPIRGTANPDQSVRLRVLWKFDKPLDDGARMIFTISQDGKPPVARHETAGFFRNARPFSRVRPNESILDFVEIPLDGSPPGHYRLYVEILDPDGLEPDKANRTQKVGLMDVDIR